MLVTDSVGSNSSEMLGVCTTTNTHARTTLALVGGLSGLSAVGLGTKRLLVRFPVRAQAWVVGQVPSRGRVRGNHTLMFLSLSFSFPSPHL